MAAEPENPVYINFEEMDFVDNILYFKPEDDGELESDQFRRLDATHAIFRNLNGQILFVDQGKQAVFEDMTDAEKNDNEPHTRLLIYKYKDTLARGLPVTLSVDHGKRHTLSCANKVISFQEMDPPIDIDDTKSDIIFFQRSVSGHENQRQFESSFYKGHFLACQKENNFFKLVLKEKNNNYDKSLMFTIENN